MRTRIWLLALSLLVVPLGIMTSACGGDGANGSKTQAPPQSSGPAGTDEEYLKAICSGVQEFSDAVVSKTKPEEIAAVIKDFAARMEAANPPADLRSYNQDFVKYLNDSLNDPTRLLTQKPPLPPVSVRQRLSSKESSVPECKSPTFFDSAANSGG